MKITWLGQAGFLLEKGDIEILIDPYLSDACAKANPNSYRRTPLDESYLKRKPQVIVLTHEHVDHYDPETLAHYLTADSGVTVLAAKNAWNKYLTNEKNPGVTSDECIGCGFCESKCPQKLKIRELLEKY